MSRSSSLLIERAGLVGEARGLYERAARDGRDFTSEDYAQFKNMMDRADTLQAEARSAEARERAMSWRTPPAGYDPGVKMYADPQLRARVAKSREYRSTPQYRGLFLDWLVRGSDIAEHIPPEFRDTVIGTDAKGGYLTTPVVITDRIVRLIGDLVWIRSKATVLTLVMGKSMGIPQISTDMADSNWSTETAAIIEDTSMVLSQRILEPKLLSKLCKASMRFMLTVANADMFLANELGYKFGVTEERAFMTGSGVGQPLGLYTADANGIDTSRDVSTGNTATAIGPDNLFAMKYGIKQVYRIDPSCAWIWSPEAVRQIILLKDTTGHYLWEPSTQFGQPDKLLNIPVCESAFAPNTFTTGLYVGLIGAFRYYYIVEYDDLTIQRVTELYSGTNTIGLIARRFVDGSPIVAEAFARCKLA
jgi:HK97 family phage major capsid protein